MTPLGARNMGGSCADPTGSLASVAADQASNHPAGMRSAFFSSATPFNHRSLADDMETERYAPSGPPVSTREGVLRSHCGAYSTSLFTFALFCAVYQPMMVVPHDHPMRLIFSACLRFRMKSTADPTSLTAASVRTI